MCYTGQREQEMWHTSFVPTWSSGSQVAAWLDKLLISHRSNHAGVLCGLLWLLCDSCFSWVYVSSQPLLGWRGYHSWPRLDWEMLVCFILPRIQSPCLFPRDIRMWVKKRLCFLTSPIARTKEQIYLEEYDRNNYQKLLGLMWKLGTSHCASTLCDNCYQICPASAHGSQISWSTQNHLTCYRLLGWAGLLYLDGIVVST